MMQTKLSLNQNSFGSKGASFFPTPGFGFYSPLSAALFSVLFQAGSHGLSVCEALKKLARQGYSKLLNSDVHTRAVQVKSALRSCPAFKEIEGKKFVLRFNRQHDPAISPKQLCKREKVRGKRCRKMDTASLNGEGPSCRPMAAVERDLGVQGPGKQTRSVQEGGDMPLDGKKQESIQKCCPLDPKHCGCIQHTSLGSLYSDCGNWSGREDIKESPYVLEGKDSGKVPYHSKDANQGDKLQRGRCRRTDGKRWRCTKEVQPGSIYCEHHHIMRRGGYKAKVADAIKAGETLPPSIRTSEGLSGTCVLKEEEGLCSEPPELASGSLQASTAQPVVATSCNLSAKEEQCETKPFLYTVESQNLEDAWKLKPEEKLTELGHSVRTMASMPEGQKDNPPALCILEEERHKVDEHVDVERSKKVENSAGHGLAGTTERTIDEEKSKAKPDLNTLEEEVLRAEEEEGEDHHSRSKASAKGLEKVVRADVASQLQASVIPFKALADKDVDGKAEKLPVKPLKLATGPSGGSVAQIVASSSDMLVEEKVRKVHKEVRPSFPRLEENELEGEQSSKKRPKLIGHGQSVFLEKHEEQEETKPDQHVLEKLRYEAKQEKAPKLHVVMAHNLEDEHRPNETVRLAGHGQMVISEKTVHQGQESAEMDSSVSAPDGLDHVQKVQEDLMTGFYRSSMMWDVKKEVSHSTSEDGSNICRGKGFHIEPLNKTGEMKVSVMPSSSSRNLKRRPVDQGDPSPSGEALFLDLPLHVLNESQSPRSSVDPSSQCHKKDGKGWHCSRQCKPGCIYCEHHQGRLSKSSTNGKKKMILQLELDKHVLATCLKGSSETQILRVAIEMPETLVKGLKTKDSHSTSRLPEGTTAAEDNDALHLGRCHRKDGKGWQCAQECKHGSIYCDRHQRQRSKTRFPRVHSQHKLVFSKGPDVQSLGYITDKYMKDKQLALPAIHITNSSLEHESKPQAKSHEIETRSGKEDDLGSALLSLRTPTRALHRSCPREAKTSEQVGKAENSPKKCHRRDGKKWQCSQLCMPGYNHCEHHQGRGRKGKVKT